MFFFNEIKTNFKENNLLSLMALILSLIYELKVHVL